MDLSRELARNTQRTFRVTLKKEMAGLDMTASTVNLLDLDAAGLIAYCDSLG